MRVSRNMLWLRGFLCVVTFGVITTNCHSLKSRLFRFKTTTANSTTISRYSATPAPSTAAPTIQTKLPLKASLPAGLTLIGSAGNKSFYTDTDKLGLTWAEALDFCHAIGLQPASIENLSEHKIARNYLAKLPHRFFWLAGTDYFHEGHWKWLRTGETFKFQRWTQGFPSKSRKNNCLYLSYGNDGWIDASCSSNKLTIRPLCQSEKNFF